MKDLEPVRSPLSLHRMIEQGENEHQDFKFTINDPIKIARSISAFANNSGGHLLIGVDDNGNVRGVKNDEDIYVVDAAASIYCKPAVQIETRAYKDRGGAVVYKVTITEAQNKPIFVKEKNGLKAYFRVADENISAHPLMIKGWRTNRDDGSLFELDTSTMTVLNKIKDSPITFEELSLVIRMPRVKLENTVLRLMSIGLVKFIYDSHKFMLSSADEFASD